MLYNVIKKYRGKEEIVMTDELTKARDYRTKMKKSQAKGIKGSSVDYIIVKASEEDEKYKKPPAHMNLSGQPSLPGPPRARKIKNGKSR